MCTFKINYGIGHGSFIQVLKYIKQLIYSLYYKLASESVKAVLL